MFRDLVFFFCWQLCFLGSMCQVNEVAIWLWSDGELLEVVRLMFNHRFLDDNGKKNDGQTAETSSFKTRPAR